MNEFIMIIPITVVTSQSNIQNITYTPNKKTHKNGSYHNTKIHNFFLQRFKSLKINKSYHSEKKSYIINYIFSNTKQLVNGFWFGSGKNRCCEL